MATYAVGDVQGCYRSLKALLREIRFDPARDRLLFVGDLVNRGPRSLDVLRFVRDLGGRAETVLGNHDLHLLSRAAGLARKRAGDTLEQVLRSRDRDDLLGWLRERPFALLAGRTLLVHAGLLPSWTVAGTLSRSARASRLLASERGDALLRALGSGDEGGPFGRAAADARVFTRLRTVDRRGAPCEGFKGAPEAAPPGCLAWYALPGRRSAGTPVVFGHWAALGLHLGRDAVCLDSGCVWKGALSALRLSDHALFQVRSAD